MFVIWSHGTGFIMSHQLTFADSEFSSKRNFHFLFVGYLFALSLVDSIGNFNSYLSQKVTAFCESRHSLLYQVLVWKKIPRPNLPIRRTSRRSLPRHRQVLPASGVTGAQVFLSHHPLG